MKFNEIQIQLNITFEHHMMLMYSNASLVTRHYFIITHKQSLQRLCFYTCLSVILFTGESASVHAGIHTPQEQTSPTGADPRKSKHPPGADTPLQADIPQSSACWEIRATSRRYASYWNAYLSSNAFNIIRKLLAESTLSLTVWFCQ